MAESINSKLSILQAYYNKGDLNKIYYTWKKTGALEATNDTSYYANNMLYKIHTSNTNGDNSLEGSLVWVNDEYVGNINWDTSTLEDASSGEISFSPNIISPNFKLILTSSEVETAETETDAAELEAWIPYQDRNDSKYVTQGTITDIPQDDYAMCLEPLGYPFVKDEELEYSPEDIIRLCFKPALRMYYKYFPRVYIKRYPCSTNVATQDFPTEDDNGIPIDCYDIVWMSLQQGAGSVGVQNIWLRYTSDLMMGNPTGSVAGGGGFVFSMPGSTSMTNGVSSYGMYLDRQAAQQAIVNKGSRVHFKKFMKADGTWAFNYYSLRTGEMQVGFAVKDNHWSHVEHGHKEEIIKLTQGYVKVLFGALRSQVKSDITGIVDYSSWVSDGKTAIAEVEDKWKTYVKAAGILRGGL